MNEVIAALYTRLNEQITDVPIYDHVPQGSDDKEYIQVVQNKTEIEDFDSELGFEVTIRIMAFSRYRGMKELNDLIDRIYSALHQWSMPDTASYSVGRLIESRRQQNTDPNGLVRYSVQDFRLYVEGI
jgi:hypothetical protein